MREIRTLVRNGDTVTMTLEIEADPAIFFGRETPSGSFAKEVFKASETFHHVGAESLMSYSKYASALCRMYMRIATDISKKINEIEGEFGRCPMCEKTYDRGDVVCSKCKAVRL